MATLDVCQKRNLLINSSLISELPDKILQAVRDCNSRCFLDAIATAATIPKFTNRLFAIFEDSFADICARWALSDRQPNTHTDIAIISSFARILPFAPYLSVYLERYLHIDQSSTMKEQQQQHTLTTPTTNILRTADSASTEGIISLLLAVWRLLNFDHRTYSSIVAPQAVQRGFEHQSAAVRFLAVRIFCLLLKTSDAKLEALIERHCDNSDISMKAEYDGEQKHFRFLSIYEQRRAKEIVALREERDEQLARMDERSVETYAEQPMTDFVIRYGNAMLPRPLGPAKLTTSLAMTPTTVSNLNGLARSLQKTGPILLYGLPGAGKTSLIHEIAKELRMEEDMVTLHLNEQTDAKMLIGLYTTDKKPGSFTWRPGVLTTAVREGRWVLIEDLDRAPNEVMSTLLPLVERGELIIPSRGETIRAPNSFRLFATVRTTRNMIGQENIPSLLGIRFWQQISVQMPPSQELGDIILSIFPLLKLYIPEILRVYDTICVIARSTPASRGVLQRQPSPRDLLKWCRRRNQLLESARCKTGTEPLDDTTRDWMFKEAVDCFVGSIPSDEFRYLLTGGIAKEMHRAPEAVDDFLAGDIPVLHETDRQMVVGRTTLHKLKRSMRITKSKKPFAATSHAKRLLEQIAAAVKLSEPVLLVGETGIGKTTVVQQLAESLGHKLIAVNLSQQSEVGDLLGGFKPVNVRSLAVPLKEEFEDLFSATGVAESDQNQKFFITVGKLMAKGDWVALSKSWRQGPKVFSNMVEKRKKKAEKTSPEPPEGGPSMKKRKVESKLQALLELKPRWDDFDQKLDQFDVHVSGGDAGFAFSFVEGKIVKAARNGDWVLLDEINLASSDTLESIASLLQSGPNSRPSILLSETGEIERIQAHPEFRIFGAMNPATDIGKRDLPIGIRSRFTELYVGSPDKDLKDLLEIIKTYLRRTSIRDDKAADDIARLYLDTKRLATEKQLVDGANDVPHFSLRTLTRVLTYVSDIAPFYGLRRALYEGFSMGFLTLLDKKSEELLMPRIHEHLFGKIGGAKKVLSTPPKRPADGRSYVEFINKNRDRRYWLLQGRQKPIERTDYIITTYVERNLLNLVRATSTRRFPILIQGPTSSGKTSMIEYLANYSGNKFVRINNHEHTDLQEYLGTYISGLDGKLRFQEGLLVQAMRQGYWIVLDELNLAPTDVLEALNRLLDDNRELLIPETQEIVTPHENFMLFATQNPPGLYGGRKVLSRAFRNRFLELHYDDIPEDELEFILKERAKNTSPPDCKRIVGVYKELSRLRQTSRLFENKGSFATLRDLFRWALRDAENREQIAAHGFMLLAERVRNAEERDAVREVIEKEFKVKIDSDKLYDSDAAPGLKNIMSLNNSQGVVWTRAMRRLYVLISNALRNNEPVLLVGDTGCGKTTVCQILAETAGRKLHIVNAHQNTETGDLIGSQRPVRNRAAILDTLKAGLLETFQALGMSVEGTAEELVLAFTKLGPKDVEPASQHLIRNELKEHALAQFARGNALFEWCDGSLVHAMKNGQFFLLDEISLADDSVLERLNSVLEPQRSLLLAEKGGEDASVTATEGFQFFSTMNPGGDFGKKELSPALRNRFTEIWVPPMTESSDILGIVKAKLDESFHGIAKNIVEFSYWFGREFRSASSTAFSIRDILTWVRFINDAQTGSVLARVLNGAATVFIDTLGANPSALMALDVETMDAQRQKCLDKLSELFGENFTTLYRTQPGFSIDGDRIVVGDFTIPRDPLATQDVGFSFQAPTTRLNAMRVARALQIQKPILLEGNPGVGKTTLISALAQACGSPLTRINLSDQTDLMDLFGTDVPVEGAEAGNFAWRDAPFLQAMQKGEWVLLDEMNLASQSVLEGLNACLDHRGEVYISELDQVFKRHPNFRLFAAQNPHHQGGGRKGLPSSFVNRFVVVYCDVFADEDLYLITTHNFPTFDSSAIKTLIRFISELEHKISIEKAFGAQGGPWEFNLRDILRWVKLSTSQNLFPSNHRLHELLDIVIRQRFRSSRDRQDVTDMFCDAIATYSDQKQISIDHNLYHSRFEEYVQVGIVSMNRDLNVQPASLPGIDTVPRLPELESMLICVRENIPLILTGASGSGKTVLLQHVAALAGKALVVFPLNADVDTMDLVGGFEQADAQRSFNAALGELHEKMWHLLLAKFPDAVPPGMLQLFDAINKYNERRLSILDLIKTMQQTADLFAANGSGPPSPLLGNIEEMAARISMPSSPRFEWMDGIIVKALEKGQWLVLDNANLCSASVLDRLNSLLEPNGFLSINEHCGPGGESRIIRPHPDFRIFLTMDPRYGELSRAMRNRAVEIFLDDTPATRADHATRICPVESSLERIWTSEAIGGGDDELQILSMDLVAPSDSMFIYRGYLDEMQNKTLKLVARRKGANFIGFENVPPMVALSTSFWMQQPAEILANEPLVPLMEMYLGNNVYRMALGGELSKQVPLLDTRLRESSQARGSVAKLSRLQRSAMAVKNVATSKESTVNIYRFLKTVLDTAHEMCGACTEGNGDWRVYQDIMYHVMMYWSRTFKEAGITSSRFDEARFQAHLVQGRQMLGKMCERLQQGDPMRQSIKSVMTSLDQDFDEGFKLSTGQSMELLWQRFRPAPLKSKRALTQAVELEHLADQFDDLRWKVDSSVTDLSSVVAKLSDVYKNVRCRDTDAGDVIAAMSQEIQSLSSKVADDTVEHKPLLIEEFNSLRQAVAFQGLADGKTVSLEVQDVVVLSNTTSKSQMAMQSRTESSAPLQTLSFILGDHADLTLWKGLSSPLLTKLMSSSATSLASFKSLETELPIMTRAVANNSQAVTSTRISHLSSIAQTLILEVISVHDQELSDTIKRGMENIPSELGQREGHLRMIAHEVSTLSHDRLTPHFAPHLTALLDALAVVFNREMWLDNPKLLAVVWFQLAFTLLGLYVPDKAFDPQLYPLIQREYQEGFQAAGEHSIKLLEEFQLMFTGQRDSLRQRIAQEMLDRNHEDMPDLVVCYRPEESELGRLQAEFSGISNSIIKSNLGEVFKSLDTPQWEQAQEELEVVRENVSRMIDRLSLGHKAYQDMTVPAINILHCLQIAILLTEIRQGTSDDFGLCELVPTMGGTLPPRFSDADMPKPTWAEGRELDLLSFFEAVVAVEGTDALSNTQGRIVDALFSSIYQQWRRKLDADRKAHEAKQSLYRFKGSLEDEEEIDEQEFNALFPTYEGEETYQPPTARDITVKVAEMHKKIFVPHRPCEEILEELAISAGRQVTPAPIPTMDRQLLSAALLAMHTKTEELNVVAVAADYNFYTDSNLPESRKLVQLVTDIRVRFRSLQLVDEIGHMQPLADVVNACHKVLGLNYDDPLAKIIPRVEHLHGFVYEWQFGGWAGRQWAVLPLYNRLTDLLVSWRRLELSTWSKLFDLEIKKCQEDAMSWWFIAYGAVIEEPVGIVATGGDLSDHVAKLVKQLEDYFATATTGQFSSRLSMIKQLQKQLEVAVIRTPHLTPVLTAIQNFTEILRNFEGPVKAGLQAGRAPLEKKMKDVLLLASWKDTNIVALRESAKKSHQKLFRIIRKFRGVLSQPVKAILDQGPPDAATPTITMPINIAVVELAGGDALSKCQAIPGWLEGNRRLVNTPKTLAIMVQAATRQDSIQAAAMLASFGADLNNSIVNLRKETPKTLTEENKNEVNHLKARKRRLFADTLKSVRQMGFKFNLGTDRLASQDSLSSVLVRMGHLSSSNIPSVGSAVYHTHRVLDLMPRARQAVCGHSEDLTSAEVSRSLGLLEGILDVILSQQRSLSDSFIQLQGLDKSVGWASNVGESAVVIANPAQQSRYSRQLAWSEAALAFGRRLVEIHSELGAIDNKEIMANIEQWMRDFNQLNSGGRSHPPLPPNLTTADQASVSQQWTDETFPRFQADMTAFAEKREDLAWVFEGVSEYVTLPKAPEPEVAAASICLLDLAKTVSSIADKALVAIEKLKKALAGIPASHEDAGWLMEYNAAMEACIAALHIQDFTAALQQLFASFEETDSEARQYFPVLLAAVVPILRQYTSISRHFLDKFAEFHSRVCELGFNLARSFTQLASQGFCTPQDPSDETSKESGKLEDGTGLGDGNGVEDISKDIKDDEDLSELAQQAQKEKKEDDDEIGDEKDAVDMADEDLEGEMGDKEASEEEDGEKEKEDGEEDEDGAISEEAGDVDDLDPNAVDEKMWDGEPEEGEKEQKGEKEMGKKGDEEQAADDKAEKQKQDGGDDEQMKKEGDEDGEEEEGDSDEGLDEGDIKPQVEADRQDQNVQEEEALDLPDDMEIEGDGKDISESEDDLDDLEDVEGEPQEQNQEKEKDGEDEEMEDAANAEPAQPAEDENVPEEEIGKEGEPDGQENMEDEPQDDDPDPRGEQEGQQNDALGAEEQSKLDQDNVAPSDQQGTGLDQSAEQDNDDTEFQANAAQQADGNVGEGESQEKSAAGNDGTVSRSAETAEEQGQNEQEQEITQPFKKLGDVLEQWHRRQRDILATPQENKQDGPPPQNTDLGKQEFQHLQDENSQEDAQAMGGAKDEDAHPFDDSMAIDDEETAGPQAMQEDKQEDEDASQADKMDVDEPINKTDNESKGKDEEDPRSGSAIQKGTFDPSAPLEEGDERDHLTEDDEEEDVEQTSLQLSTTHLDPTPSEKAIHFGEALQQWAQFQSKTHALSLNLTSQLRLILTPSQATKLSGAFRTGKRLNIKRIIPYIASSYKRDKIWMRRAVPTKRCYQVLLAVDDSESMMGSTGSGAASGVKQTGENRGDMDPTGPASMALESLVMVSRSLAMLEVGKVGVLGFGKETFVAHGLEDPPFTSPEAGAKALQKFSFKQSGTEVQNLLRRTIDIFSEARNLNAGGGAGQEDLWQLAIVLSDGLASTGQFEGIRRLLREAGERKVMVVFVVLDAKAKAPSGAGVGAGGANASTSILHLKQARMEKTADGRMEVKVEKYLDGFPFQYYLIIREMEELPNALAGLLRQWFGEVSG
ncbi:hypothetical protein MKZ38_006154 [Zalerion maritima]|uniref:Midasin n=1 Tax=Zalerion maritima TaxID=339359 RepID=A0AAD5RJU3_9PEZI|nr:hypothetical protein MKZ38_006154 [Zalerion maritima]